MKKFVSLALAGILVLSMAACGSSSENSTASTQSQSTTAAAQTEAPTTAQAEAADTEEKGGDDDTAIADGGTMSGPINVISREDGSGTRGAFIELFGIEVKNEAGEKEDMTMEDAQITNSTSVMMTTVSGDESTIGYISLGSLNDTIKALKIDGAEASAENVKNGTYKVSRPFNIITKDGLSDAAQDFVNFIMSSEGQAVVEENGYIPVEGVEAYAGTSPEGKVVVAGSSSVTPVMEKLAEAYKAVNANVEIEVQQSDSTTGVTSASDGLCDIGMASRDLKEEEQSLGLTATVIATDGIAVIVNNNNPVSDLTSEQVKAIYTGEILNWEDLAK